MRGVDPVPTAPAAPAAPRAARNRPAWVLAAEIGAFVALYFVTARLGLRMDAVSGFATAVWPPAGLSLAALVLFGRSMWPGIALGAFLVNFTAGAPVAAACGMAAGNTLEALLGLELMRRYAGFRGSLDRLQPVVGFLLFAAGLSTLVSASIGVASGALGGAIPAASAGRAWVTWWLGDALGDLLLLPLLLAWAERRRLDGWTAARVVEGAALLAALVFTARLVFGAQVTTTQAIFVQPYALFPLLIWAALRFEPYATVTATFVVAAIAIQRTAAGLGPFARATLADSLLPLQVFLGIVAVTVLILSAGVSERRRYLKRVEVNHAAAMVLAGASALEGVFPRILEALCDRLDWDCGNVWIVDESAGILHFAAEWHRSLRGLDEFGSIAVRTTFRRGEGLAGRVWSAGRPLWAADILDEPAMVRGSRAASIGLRSAMGFPIVSSGEVQGVMTFFNRAVQEPDESMLQMMATLGSMIGGFVRRQRAEADLRAAHAELEARIARRTEQLTRLNSALQAEVAERQQAEDSLRELSTRLLRIQDEERQRLARELHDSTAQVLAALCMNLAVARENGAGVDPRTERALAESALLADRCAREIRTLSYLLHPPLLKEVGLPAAVRWCAEGFARRSGIAVDVDLPEDFGRLPMDVENALFRIVQECLTNVQRHSGSPTASIQLAREDGRIALEVRDEGRGMPEEVVSPSDPVGALGVGLLGMRERVRQLGGELRIESSPRGALVQVEIQVESGEA